MKTKHVVAAVLIGLLVLSSCGDGELTKVGAERALKKNLVLLQDSSQYATIDIGYYQLDDKQARLTLRQLAGAGVITYSADKIIEKVRKSQGWYRPTYYYVDVERFFVKVDLTEVGRKLVISEPVVEIPDKDLEYKIKEKYTFEVPYSEIEDGAKPATSTPSPAKIENSDNTDIVDYMDEEEIEEPVVNETGKSTFQIAKERSNKRSYTVLTHSNKLIKVKNVYCPEEALKKGEAACAYIYEQTNVTPFGFFIKGIQEGERKIGMAGFNKYTDEGWKVVKF